MQRGQHRRAPGAPGGFPAETLSRPHPPRRTAPARARKPTPPPSPFVRPVRRRRRHRCRCRCRRHRRRRRRRHAGHMRACANGRRLLANGRRLLAAPRRRAGRSCCQRPCRRPCRAQRRRRASSHFRRRRRARAARGMTGGAREKARTWPRSAAQRGPNPTTTNQQTRSCSGAAVARDRPTDGVAAASPSRTRSALARCIPARFPSFAAPRARLGRCLGRVQG
jgi:hypothetical protein